MPDYAEDREGKGRVEPSGRSLEAHSGVDVNTTDNGLSFKGLLRV